MVSALLPGCWQTAAGENRVDVLVYVGVRLTESADDGEYPIVNV